MKPKFQQGDHVRLIPEIKRVRTENARRWMITKVNNYHEQFPQHPDIECTYTIYPVNLPLESNPGIVTLTNQVQHVKEKDLRLVRY